MSPGAKGSSRNKLLGTILRDEQDSATIESPTVRLATETDEEKMRQRERNIARAKLKRTKTKEASTLKKQSKKGTDPSLTASPAKSVESGKKTFMQSSTRERWGLAAKKAARSFVRPKVKVDIQKKYQGVQAYTKNQIANRNLNFIQELSAAKRSIYDHLPKVPTGASDLKEVLAAKGEIIGEESMK